MLEPGQTVAGQYEIQRVLGVGSFSTVYLAHDRKFPGGRRVAIKEFNPDAFPPQDREWARDTIAQEARLRGNLPSHSGLANVLGYFEAGERSYLVLEYVEGQTLEQAWRAQPGRRFSEEQVLAWADQLCDVLAFLHNQSPPIIYRDLKPANIMLPPDGSLKLIDFGIARLHQPQRSGDTINLGTPGYAAPEQYRNEQSDSRTDVYALGVILHQLLTGVDPSQHILNLPPPRELNPAISPRVAGAIEQATAHEPSWRFRNAVAMATALRGGSPGATTTEPAAPDARRPRPLLFLGAILLLGLAGVALVFLLGEDGDDANEPVAAITTPPAQATGATDPPREGDDAPADASAIETAALQATAAAQSTIAGAVAATGAAEREQAARETTQTAQAREERQPTVTATPAPIPTTTSGPLPDTWTGDDGRPMALVPAGDFIMGSTARGVEEAMAMCRASAQTACGAEEFTNEMPQRSVTLDAFYMDLTEVTNAEYAACVRDGGCSEPVAGRGIYQPQDYYHNPTFADYPVIYVTWHDARAYCRWAGKALPTEAQWEKAARGTDGRVFPWGNQWDCNRTNTEECGGDRLHPVASFPTGASPYGLLDMAGSVWEWVEDAFDPTYYERAPDINPPPATGGGVRVLRGGGFSNHRHYARTANRGFEVPGTSSAYRGFRCALDAGAISP